MFRRKKKEIPPLQQRCRASIVQEVLTLISVANKAESESVRTNGAENTDVQELCRTSLILEAQTALTERIVLSESYELTLREIASELIQPVLERSVVGDVAQQALDHALHSAEEKLAAR